MSKRRKKPRGHDEPLFSGYSLEAVRERSAEPLSMSASVLPIDATPIPRAGEIRARAYTTATARAERGPRPHAPQGADVERRIQEVQDFPARLLATLPGAFTMMCEACLDGSDGSVLVVVTTSAEDYATARQCRYVTLHGAEFAAVALAAELDRVSPPEFERWCVAKQRDRSWELTPHVTLGVYIGRHDQRRLTVGDVLHRCGAVLLNVAATSPAPRDFWEVLSG
jgi:hypothetical protein